MGTPTLQPFKAQEILRLLKDAKITTKEDMIQALDRFRLGLIPLVQWLDVPVREWADDTHRSSKQDRIMPVFESFGDQLPPIGLSRAGEWLFSRRTGRRSRVTTSSYLVDMIALERVNILSAFPFPMEKGRLLEVEGFLGNDRIIVRAAFLRYLESGLTSIKEMLGKREERLVTMRSHLNNLQLFKEAADPIVQAGTLRLPGYAEFESTGNGCRRVSGTYLTRKPVADHARQSQNRSFVYEDTSHCDSLSGLLWRLVVLAEETHESGICGRDPFSDEERDVLRHIVSGI